MIVSTRVQGVDCQYCEDSIEHRHVTQAEIDESIIDARRILALEREELAASNTQTIDYRLSRALLAVDAERNSWKRRAAKHGCDVDSGDLDCA